MPVLKNARHEKFAQELAKGKTGDEAYVLAGYVENRANAARLKSNEPIRKRVEEILSAAAEKVEFGIAEMAAQLDEDRAFARECLAPGPAVSASMGKAKVLGLIVDKTAITGRDGGPVQVEVSDVEVARRLAFILERGRRSLT